MPHMRRARRRKEFPSCGVNKSVEETPMAEKSNTGKRYIENEDGSVHCVTDEQLYMYHATRSAVGKELADKLLPHPAQYLARQRRERLRQSVE